MKTIICADCGEKRLHVAKGMCDKCYKHNHYIENRDRILAQKKATSAIKQDLRQEAICRRLHAILFPMIPDGAQSRHLSWDQATNLYNHGKRCKKEHFLALCRAVQAQGAEWGLIAHKRPVGGVEIVRL